VRYAKQRDKNEPAIVKALVAAGATVTRISEMGVPDLLVGFRGDTFLLEVKRPVGPRGGRRPKGGLDERGLAKTQVEWWAKWTGRPPVVVTSPEEALAAIGMTAEAMP
jgi:hypothetical protein